MKDELNRRAALVLLVSIVGCFLLGLSIVSSATPDQLLADQVRIAGGDYSVSKMGWNVTRRLFGRTIGAHRIGPFDRITELHLGRVGGVMSRAPSNISDAVWDRILDTPSIVRVNLSETNIRDEQVKHLIGLPNLRDVDLSWTSVTDDSCRHLAKCTTIESIALQSTKVSDRGIHFLSNHQSLKSINLRDTNITDASLVALSKVGHLEQLDVSFTHITEASLAEFENQTRAEIRY